MNNREFADLLSIEPFNIAGMDEWGRAYWAPDCNIWLAADEAGLEAHSVIYEILINGYRRRYGS